MFVILRIVIKSITTLTLVSLVNNYSLHSSEILGQAKRLQKQLRTNFYGIVRDPDKAYQLFLESAEAGDIDAAYNLGYMFYRGDGVTMSRDKALEWWIKASDKGHISASYQAAQLMKNGSTKDRVLACKLFTRALEGGLLAASFESGLCRLQTSKKEACDLFEQSHLAGFAEGTYNHAWCIHKQSTTKALKLLKQALNKGLAEASTAIYVLSEKKSLDILEQGIQLGNAHAEYLLFEHYKANSSDPTAAIKHLTNAAEKGVIRAQYELGQQYYHGQLVERNYESSFYWWKMAALQGNAQSQFNLGHLYLTGRGVKMDLVLASAWFNIAAKYNSKFTAHMSVNQMLNPEQKIEVQELLTQGLEGFVNQRKLQLAKASGNIKQSELVSNQESPNDASSEDSLKKSFMENPQSVLAEVTEKAQNGDVQMQLLLGRWYSKNKQFSKAASWLSQAIKTEESARLDLAKIYISLKKPKKCLELLKSTSDVNSKNLVLKATQLHGDQLYENFKNEEAREVYLQLERLHVNKSDFDLLSRLIRIHDSIGSDLFAAGKQKKAEEILEKSLEYAERLKKSYPDRAETYLLLAVSTGNLARFKSGKDKIRIGGAVEGYCLKAIEINPKLGRPYSILATYYWEISKLSWILKAFARSFLGKLPEKSRDDALKLYQTSLENNPDQIYGQYKMADLLIAMNRKDEAKKHLKIVINLKPLSTGDKRVQDSAKALLAKIGG